MKEQQYEAVFEDEVFKPVGIVSLPKGTKVVVKIQSESATVEKQSPVDAQVVEILARRYNSGQSGSPVDVVAAKQAMHESLARSYETGQTDLAERHNEHQP